MKVLLILALVFLAGCTKVLLPYEEYQLCRKGMESGLCGSLSDVYEHSIRNDRRR